jgi:hypothetical protein
MHDSSTRTTPLTWGDAFAALPQMDPPDHWPAIAARTGRRRARAVGWLALAATLLVAIGLPWKLQHEQGSATQAHMVAPVPRGELDTLYAESAQLEALLAYARDDRVASGNAEVVSGRLDQKLALIDAELGQPGLPATRQRELWTQRVATLRALASFESNRRLLSARGEHYDGALMRID